VINTFELHEMSDRIYRIASCNEIRELLRGISEGGTVAAATPQRVGKRQK
jgi:hypothetical protein